MKKLILAAIALGAVVSAHVATAAEDANIQTWWETNAGPGDLTRFNKCEVEHESANPAEDMVEYLKHNAQLVRDPELQRFERDNAQIAFIKASFPNGVVNVFAFATTPQACEAIRAGTITQAPARTWYVADFGEGRCHTAAASPDELDRQIRNDPKFEGVPDTQVQHDTNGNVTGVMMTVRYADSHDTVQMFFAPSMALCESLRHYMIDHGAVPDRNELK